MEQSTPTMSTALLAPRNYSWPARVDSLRRRSYRVLSASDVIRTAHDIYRAMSESPGAFGYLQSKAQSIVSTLIAVSHITEAYSYEGRLDASTRNELKCLSTICRSSLQDLESLRCGFKSLQPQKKKFDEVKSVIGALEKQTQELERINKRTRESVIELTLVRKYASEMGTERRESYDSIELAGCSISSRHFRTVHIPRPMELAALTASRLNVSRNRILHMLEVTFGEYKGQIENHSSPISGIPSQLRRLLASSMSASRVLLLAIERGIVMDVIISIERGANVNIRNSKGDTPLILAIRRSHVGMVLLLLQQKANPNKCSKSPSFSPLRLALHTANMKIIKLLLDHGANVNEFSLEDHMAPLHWAIKQNHHATVSLLLDHGADMHLRTQSRHGETPLCMAISLDAHEIVQELLIRSTNVNQESSPVESPYTALSLAVKRNNMRTMKLLFQMGANTNLPARVSELPLYIAVQENLTEIAGVLLSHGADQDLWERGSEKQSPLLVAVEGKNMQMVELMLSWRRKSISEAVFAKAIHNQHMEMLDLLLTHKPRGDLSNLVDKVVQLGHDEILRLLLKNGIEIKTEKSTALFAAIRRGDLEVLKVLINHGAKVNARAPVFNHNGILVGRETPVWLAAAEGHAEILEFLLQNGGKVDQLVSPRKCSTHRLRECLFAESKVLECSAIQIAVAHGHEDCVRLLLKHGAILHEALRRERAKGQWCTELLNIHAQQRLLHFAIEQSHLLVERVELLLELGFNVNMKGTGGQTALHVAVRPDLRRTTNESLRLVPLLLEKGAEINARDDYDLTALHIAVGALDPEPKLIDLLIAHGANVNARDFRGWTPLHYAGELVNEESWSLLSKSGADASIVDIEGRTAPQIKETLSRATGPSGLIYQRRWSARGRIFSFGYLGSY